jgi:hypothetical protein
MVYYMVMYKKKGQAKWREGVVELHTLPEARAYVMRLLRADKFRHKLFGEPLHQFKIMKVR